MERRRCPVGAGHDGGEAGRRKAEGVLGRDAFREGWVKAGACGEKVGTGLAVEGGFYSA